MAPVQFVLGVHNHQPVGNFDFVFEEHVRDAYMPFLSSIAAHDFFPVALHVSGPLFDWMETHDPQYLDLVGRLVADERVELLVSGFSEPVLAALSPADRVDQIGWMRERLKRRFGISATGLWLTERVWEPELITALTQAGVEYVLVDDRHFLVCGFERDELHGPYRTESDGESLAVLPIDERLRYLVPFRPVEEIAAYFHSLEEAGQPLAVLADDGEKFGGWPGTREWVYERGWLDRFLERMQRLIDDGVVRLVTPADAVRNVESRGLAYLPTASYREMEGWSLPPRAATRLIELESALGQERVEGPEGPLIRGGHWRHFFAKYPESNRMHKKMQRLSRLCRERGNPRAARHAIALAQCNDAYWHGVFGGLYLPHLRRAVWKHLARAEAELRSTETIAVDAIDIDQDGHEELWVHSAHFSAIVSPRRGGSIEEYTVFAAGRNYLDVLTRTIEVYHRVSAPADHGDAEGGMPSIHEIEAGMTMTALPPTDLDPRALFVDRVVSSDLAEGAYAAATYEPVASWARTAFTAEVTVESTRVTIDMTPNTETGLTKKQLTFGEHGDVTVRYQWRASAFPSDAWFAPEMSLAEEIPVHCTPEAPVWSYPINTVAKSERGLDETRQGFALTPRWPVKLGEGTIEIRPT